MARVSERTMVPELRMLVPLNYGESLCRLSDAQRAIAELRTERDTLRQQLAERDAEIMEQCRLNGMGAERELKLLTQRDKLAGLLRDISSSESRGLDWAKQINAALAEVNK